MIQYLKNLILKMKSLWSISAAPAPLTMMRNRERFDVVERVPVYARIKF